MQANSIFVRTVFGILVLASAASIIAAQEPPGLPPDNSPPPDLSQPPFLPKVAVQRVRTNTGNFTAADELSQGLPSKERCLWEPASPTPMCEGTQLLCRDLAD